MFWSRMKYSALLSWCCSVAIMTTINAEDVLPPNTPANQANNDGVFIITAYRSFNGRAKNGSETVINALRSQPDLNQVQFHALDVGWKQVEEFMRLHVNGKNIRGIIGLGEGYPGYVAIELFGKNSMNGADEFGIEGNGAAIIDGKPNRNRSRLQYSLNEHIDYQLPVLFSTNAGDFLCNYLLYHCNNTTIPVTGFIHVPPQGSAADDNYLQTTLTIVADLVRQNITAPKSVGTVLTPPH